MGKVEGGEGLGKGSRSENTISASSENLIKLI